jgi:hypothetical protein
MAPLERVPLRSGILMRYSDDGFRPLKRKEMLVKEVMKGQKDAVLLYVSRRKEDEYDNRRSLARLDNLVSMRLIDVPI